eukprot:scaffold2494_cov67-Isochrysis_galbana.AAC.1
MKPAFPLRAPAAPPSTARSRAVAAPAAALPAGTSATCPPAGIPAPPAYPAAVLWRTGERGRVCIARRRPVV